jgi:hypothetical protein
MSFNTLVSLGLCGLLLAVAPARAAKLIPVEEALETQALYVSVNAGGRGQVGGRACEGCPQQRFTLAPKVRFSTQGQAADVAALRARNGQSATIIYNLESGLATKVLW